MLLADVFITTKMRRDLFSRSIRSFFKNTDPSQYRLTIIEDSGDGMQSIAAGRQADRHHVDHVIVHGQNLGLGPSINEALAHIDATNRWYDHPTHGEPSLVAPFVCYCQDDLQYTPGWLERLSKMFILMEKQHRLGFASGVECVEHETKKDIGGGMVLKDWIRAANMFARREYWMSMFPIPRFDPETGRVRAKPNDGMGSGVDWHFIRNHENSVCKTGRSCLVIPGLLRHMGYARSTWLDREMPESESDKKLLDEVTV